jgi:hypothetical protein
MRVRAAIRNPSEPGPDCSDSARNLVARIGRILGYDEPRYNPGVSLNPSFPLVVAFASGSAMAQDNAISPRAAPDISAFATPQERKALDEALKPYAAQARNTFPGAAARFLAGLKKGESLFVTTRIYDELTRSELVLISVARIQGGIVEGRIWTRPHVVTTHGFRDWYGFPETQLVDWLIVNPDGADEGNVLGNFMKVPR